MSRTDLDPTTLASSLRRMAGDGSVEWVHEPMQTCVLLDVADMLDELELWHRLTVGIKFPEYPMTQFKPKDLERENAKLRELLWSYWKRVHSPAAPNVERDYLAEMRELGVEVDE